MIVYKSSDFKIALFIDAENVSYNNAGRIIDILEKKGKIAVREIVADWTKINVAKKDKKGAKNDNLSGWRGVAATCSMTAIQQFTYRPNKNSSDIALAIRAMKTLYEKPFIDLFCIVSNDCDFTRLAQELREHNKEVIGMGEKEKSIEEFVKAFSEYIYLDERLEDEDNALAAEPRKIVPVTAVQPENKKVKKAPVESVIGNARLASLVEIIRELIDDRGRALYSNINGLMKNKYPDFVPQNFGCKNFRQLMDALMPDLTEFEKVATNDDFALVEKKN